MRRWWFVVTFVLALALTLAVYENPADSPECREWQRAIALEREFVRELGIPPVALGTLMERRPDGCAIP
jgi:acyl-coenzyme A synthetase/AMP-(fatty) acid ligase